MSWYHRCPVCGFTDDEAVLNGGLSHPFAPAAPTRPTRLSPGLVLTSLRGSASQFNWRQSTCPPASDRSEQHKRGFGFVLLRTLWLAGGIARFGARRFRWV